QQVPADVNETGLEFSRLLVPSSEFGPAVGPSVHDVTAAIPFAFVVTGVVGVTEPPPDATANVTLTPATGLPFASCTITDGSIARSEERRAGKEFRSRRASCAEG